jgi:hypothetical protein
MVCGGLPMMSLCRTAITDRLKLANDYMQLSISSMDELTIQKNSKSVSEHDGSDISGFRRSNADVVSVDLTWTNPSENGKMAPEQSTDEVYEKTSIASSFCAYFVGGMMKTGLVVVAE